jgi:hypothetical protein
MNRFLLTFTLLCLPFIGTSEIKQTIDSPVFVAVIFQNNNSKKPTRVFVHGHTVYQKLDDFLNFLSKQIVHPTYPSQYVINGQCDVGSPQFTSEEIEEIKQTCKKHNLLFKYNSAG